MKVKNTQKAVFLLVILYIFKNLNYKIMKIKLVFFLLFYISALQAQNFYEANRKIKNLNLSLLESDNGINLNFDFKYVKIIQNNIAIGVKIGFNTIEDDNSFDAIDESPDEISLMPTIRYIIPQTERSMFFADLSLGKSYSEAFEGFGSKVDMSFGYAFFLNKSIGFEPKVFLDYSRYRDKGNNGYTNYDSKYSIFNYGLGIDIQFYFDKLNLFNRNK